MKGCEKCFCRFDYIYDYCPYCGTKYVKPKLLKKSSKLINLVFTLKNTFIERTFRNIRW